MNPRDCHSNFPLRRQYGHAALLSMFPVSTYPPDLFYTYCKMTVLSTEYVLPDLTAVSEYLDRIRQSGNNVSAVYLGFLPDKVSLSEISSLTADYPDCLFELIMPCPFQDYWETLSDAEYSRVLDAYCSCLSDAGLLTNARLHCYTPYEWLVTNPALYKDTWLVNEDLGSYIVTHTIALDYLVTAETSDKLEGRLRTLTESLRCAPPDYPDHSGSALIFFGDSIFGNYSGGMSIPGIIYNLGLGGCTASQTDLSPLSLQEALTAFFTGNPSIFPEGCQAYSELTRYCSSAADEGGDRCFIINLGLNDYFDGCPVRSEDPWDNATYTGSIRTAVALIREHAPESQIILCTPNYSPFVPDTPPPCGKSERLCRRRSCPGRGIECRCDRQLLRPGHRLRQLRTIPCERLCSSKRAVPFPDGAGNHQNAQVTPMPTEAFREEGHVNSHVIYGSSITTESLLFTRNTTRYAA